jgi:hypothetical protein
MFVELGLCLFPFKNLFIAILLIFEE